MEHVKRYFVIKDISLVVDEVNYAIYDRRHRGRLRHFMSIVSGLSKRRADYLCETFNGYEEERT